MLIRWHDNMELSRLATSTPAVHSRLVRPDKWIRRIQNPLTPQPTPSILPLPANELSSSFSSGWKKLTARRMDGYQWHKRAIWKDWRHKSKGSKSAAVFRRPRRRNHSWQCRWSNSELRCYILDGTWLRRVWNLIPRWITSCIGSTLYPRGVRGEKRPAHGSFKRQQKQGSWHPFTAWSQAESKRRAHWLSKGGMWGR